MIRGIHRKAIAGAGALAVFLLGLAQTEIRGHGMGVHSHGPREASAEAHTHSEDCAVQGKGSKHVHMEELDRRVWGVSFETGWESKHVHYGVNETGNGSLYYNQLAATAYNFTLSAWYGVGLGSRFQELDITATYTLEVGPVFFIPGFNFRYDPFGHTEEEEDHEEDHDHEEHDHNHSQFGYEVFLVMGTTAIPYVTPSMGFLWDLANGSGGYLEFRVDGEFPVYKDIVYLNPYTLLSLNFGYNTQEYYGWNNWQFGLNTIVNITSNIAAICGVNYSVAMEALREIDQGNEFWVTVGLSFSY